jgi:hypothetical protein
MKAQENACFLHTQKVGSAHSNPVYPTFANTPAPLIIIRKRIADAPRSRGPQLAHEAKAIVVLAFRNGTIETVHQGNICP